MKKRIKSNHKIFIAMLPVFFHSVVVNAQYPGGVSSSNLIVWHTADYGWSATSWENRAPSNIRLYPSIGKTTFTSGPTITRVNSSTYNFNDAAKFNGSNTNGDYYYINYTYAFNQFYAGNKDSNWNATYFAVGEYFESTNGSNLDKAINFFSDNTSSILGCGDNRCNSGTRSSGVQFGNTQVSLTNSTTAKNMIRAGRRSSSSKIAGYSNGLATTSSSGSVTNYGSYAMAIGGWPNYYGNFGIPEVIWYKGALTDAEVNRVHSYLALKYGTTLTQTTAQNYTASDGTTIFWNNSSASNTFIYNIFGIGRDDNSAGLHQRISSSVNNVGQTTTSGSYLTISTNDNFTDANTSTNHPDISADKNFLMISDNGGLLNDYSTTITGLPADLKRSSRIWQAQKTGSAIDTVYFQFNSITNPTSEQKYFLITANDSSFSTNVSITPLSVSGGIAATTMTHNEGAANYFTIALLSGRPAVKDITTCPNDILDLGAALTGIPPTGTEVQWFDGNDPSTATQITNPSNVAAGTYYAFYYYPSLHVYSAASNSVAATKETSAECNNYCYKPAVTSGTTLNAKHGITALGRAGADNSDNWPMVRDGAWIVLESKTKGFVVNRIPKTTQVESIKNPVEGMMVYDEEAKCLKIYTTTDDGTTFSWQCFNTQTCPE